MPAPRRFLFLSSQPNEDSGSSGDVNGEGRRESNESAQSNDSDTKTLQVPQQKENEQVTDDESKEVDVPSRSLASSAVPRSSVESAAPDVETAFTGLVKKSNMFHVNGKPYAKLGVIGRGGSCKVYRVLSSDLQVLALKKVKLDGMDKKAIDSYANEIALLKSLQVRRARRTTKEGLLVIYALSHRLCHSRSHAGQPRHHPAQ